MMEYVALALAGFAVGIYVGQYLTNEKWSGNAYQIQRVEYNGRLYKVEVDKDSNMIGDPKTTRIEAMKALLDDWYGDYNPKWWKASYNAGDRAIKVAVRAL